MTRVTFQVLLPCVLTLFISGPALEGATPPMVAGYERLARSGSVSEALQGEVLLGELSCYSCHKPDAATADRILTRKAPDLSRAGERLTPQYLRQFLSNPHEAKPGTVMPDVFHASEARARDGAVDYLVHYLVSLGGPIAPSKAGATEAMVERGGRLFHSIGCIGCHAPEQAKDIETPIIPLGDLAAKTTVEALTAFLLDPIAVRHSGRMPSFRLDPDEARALAIYLLRGQLDNPQSKDAGPARTPGVRWEYYETEGLERLPDFDALKPSAEGTVPQFTLDIPKRSSNYAVRFSGLVTVPESGRYRFFTRSDDGSKLFINGAEVVNNDGTHAAEVRSGAIRLDKGDHEIVVIFFQGGGEHELQVLWSGPGIPGRIQQIPPEALSNERGRPMVPLASEEFSVDEARAQMGRQMFSALRCVSCHEMEGQRPMRPAKALADLNLDSPEGCLGDAIRRGVPNYALRPDQKSAIRAALRNRSLHEPSTPKEAVARTIAALNCYACHERDGVGGPDPARAELFETISEIDLGEEGKIPPTLTGVGAKLRAAALRQILVDGEHRVRHYMAARMPDFGEDNVRPIFEHAAAADSLGELTAEPEFSEAQWKIGHRLVGESGLSCIACHQVAGQKGSGIPGIDLATAYARLNPGWFKKFMLNPAAFNKGTRMPQFWPGGESPFKDLAGGSTERQIEAIWAYLSLQKSMPLPAGIQPAGGVGMELIPADKPIVHRTFMRDVGPRAVLVGYPEKVSVAFDANMVRMAKAWRGRFFDAAGVASGRTDAFLPPLGEDEFEFPAGPAFALLPDPQAPWPNAEARTDRDIGGHFRGYSFPGNGGPILRYVLGDVEVSEQPEPIVRPGGAVLRRHLRIQPLSENPSGQLYFLAASGERIEPKGGGQYEVDGRWSVAIEGAPASPMIRQSNGRSELIVPVPVKPEGSGFSTLLIW